MHPACVPRSLVAYIVARDEDRRRRALGKTRSTTLKSVSAKRQRRDPRSIVFFVSGESDDEDDDDDDDDKSEGGQDGDASQK